MPRILNLLLALSLLATTSGFRGAQEATPAAPSELEAVQAGGKVFLPLVSRDEVPVPPLNLLANGSFEGGNTSGWEMGGAQASTAQAHNGQWSAQLSNQKIRGAVNLQPGQTYKLTAWFRIVSESGSDWGGLTAQIYGQNFAVIGSSDVALVSTHGGQWFKVAVTFVAQEAITQFDLGYFGGAGRQMLAYVDEVMVFAKTTNQAPTLKISLAPLAFSGVPQNQNFSLQTEDVDGAVVRVLWEFGDGTRALTYSGTHRAAVPGNYLARVTVADDDGAVVTRQVAWSATTNGWPALSVSSPANAESTVNAATLNMSGTASGATLVQVSTDRGFFANASGTNSWSAAVTLQPGVNRVLVQARNAAGQISTQERVVRYVPSGALSASISNLPSTVQRWQTLEFNVTLNNSAATWPQLPYSANMPTGLKWLDGVSVEAVFTQGSTVLRRPAFLLQPYERVEKESAEWLYPTGERVWRVRFAPPSTGTWKVRVEVAEARGTATSSEKTFSVTAASGENHGPVRVAAKDSRYFEFADGTYFTGVGHGVGFGSDRFSYEAAQTFNAMGAGNQNFLRWWINGRGLWASAWQPWRSRTLGNDGYIPATSLTLERGYANGLAAFKLDAQNPVVFQGFDSGRIATKPNITYRLVIRWRAEGISGPQTPGQPYGLTVKLTGWPEPGQTGSIPVLVSHINGDTPWHVASGEFKATGNFLEYVSVILENATGGVGYVDEVNLFEVKAGGALGPQLLRSPNANSHLGFSAARSAGVDAILADAQTRGLYFKLVISEKNEYLLNHLGAEGLPEPKGGEFNAGVGSAGRWLHQAYWRYLFARFGAYRSVHSWELANESAPGPGAHFQLANDLALRAAADGNPHPVTTSTWATLAEAAWKDSASAALSYTDFHAYVRGTGWLEPKEELAHDTARFFNVYDMAARSANFGKPVVWGEMGVDSGNTDVEEPRLSEDAQGVWLRKLIWARTGPGGVYPLYWYTENIYSKNLHSLFGVWNKFMAGVPLTNGRYQDVVATTSNPNLRVLGQKDVTNGRAHLWIDNTAQTWWAVVNNLPIAPITGTVSVGLQAPNAAYTVTWYSTTTGQVTGTQTLTANSAGVLTLPISNLVSDIAAQIKKK